MRRSRRARKRPLPHSLIVYGGIVARKGNRKKQVAGPAPISFPDTCGLDLLSELVSASYSPDDAARILEGCNKPRMVTLRANTLKATRDEVANALDEASLAWKNVAFYPDAFALPHAEERDIWSLPIYEQGGLYMQSLSAMLPALMMDLEPGQDILDMCAAPGGKTTQIAALGGRQAHVTACEMHAPRAEKLEHNLAKLGAGNVTVMRTDARQLDDFFSFDRILLDAPCSGSGTLLRESARQLERFTGALIAKSRKSQFALLDKALSLLKPQGVLVYATCSVLPCENEDMVRTALSRANSGNNGKHFDIVPIRPDKLADVPLLANSLEGTVTVCPTDEFEGFYIAKIKRIA